MTGPPCTIPRVPPAIFPKGSYGMTYAIATEWPRQLLSDSLGGNAKTLVRDLLSGFVGKIGTGAFLLTLLNPWRSMGLVYLPTFTIKINQMWVYIPYMDGKWWGVSKVFWRWESLPGCPAGVVIVSRSVIVSWVIYNISRRWFQIFFIFTPICGRFPFWLIFFKGLKPPTRYVRDVYTTYTYIVVKWSMY